MAAALVSAFSIGLPGSTAVSERSEVLRGNEPREADTRSAEGSVDHLRSETAASSAPGGMAVPSGDSGAQRSDSPRVAGAVQHSVPAIKQLRGTSRSKEWPSSSGEAGAHVGTRAVEMLASAESATSPPRLQALRRTIQERRTATWRHQEALGYPHTRTAYRERQSSSVRYLRWLRSLWTERADSMYRVWVSLRDPREAICHVFGLYCSEALAVARCESGWAYSVNATNGQYLGLFQMGSYARSAYGHGRTALEQARAAYRYFVASGRNWGPWSCKP